VLDLTRYLPGAYGTFLLHALGAEVIKVEPPGGDPMRDVRPFEGTGTSRLFALACAGKKSVVADLRDPAELARVRALAATAGVVVESYRPGVADRLGVGYTALSAARPDLVYCSLRGFAPGTDREGVAGHDLNYLSLAGWVSAADGPGIARLAPGDLLGGLFAAFGVLAALAERPRGRHLRTSVYGAALSWLMVHEAAGDEPVPSEGEALHPLAGARSHEGRVCYCSSALLRLQELEHHLGLLFSLANVVIYDLSLPIDQVRFASRRGTDRGLPKRLHHFLVGVGEQREGEIVLLLEFLLLRDRVGAHAHDGNTFLLQLSARITQRTALLRAATGECSGIKPHQREVVLLVDVAEVEGRAIVGLGADLGRFVADLEGLCAGKAE
jgi:hypothetical protein